MIYIEFPDLGYFVHFNTNDRKKPSWSSDEELAVSYESTEQAPDDYCRLLEIGYKVKFIII